MHTKNNLIFFLTLSVCVLKIFWLLNITEMNMMTNGNLCVHGENAKMNELLINSHHYSSCFSCLFLYASGACSGISSSILRMKSAFSAQPLHCSSQSERIFFKSLTFNFLKLISVKSISLAEKVKIHVN